MTKWTCLHVPKSDYWTLRRLGADTEWKGYRLWINATQVRSRKFKNWLGKANERKFKVDIAFDEREIAKKHGCFWCPDAKSWCFATCRPDSELPDFVLKHRGTATRVWLRTPFELAPVCKQAGFQWDGVKKMWHIREDRYDDVKMAALKKYVVQV